MNGPSSRRLMSYSAVASSRLAGSVEILMLAIERLQSTLDAENTKIASGEPVDYQAFNQRKSQGLLELTRLVPLFQGAEIGLTLRVALFGLRTKLEDNRRLLRVQLKAVQEVSEIISRTIQAGQSDGTYSEYSWRE